MGTCYLHILLALVLSIQFFTNVRALLPSNKNSFSKRTAVISTRGPNGAQTAAYSSDDPNAGSIDDFWKENGVKADSRESSFRSDRTIASSPTLSKSRPPDGLFSNNYGLDDFASDIDSLLNNPKRFLTPAQKTKFSSDDSDTNPSASQSPPRSTSSSGRRRRQKSRASSPQASPGRRPPQSEQFNAGLPNGPTSPSFSQLFGDFELESGDTSDKNFDPFTNRNSNGDFQEPGSGGMTSPKQRTKSQQGSRFEKTNSSNGKRLNRLSSRKRKPNSKPSGRYPAVAPNWVAQLILDKHNEYREKHGVPPLTYDPKLSEFSQNYAVKLVTGEAVGHNPEAQSRHLGENLAQGMNSIDEDLETNAAKAVDRWYNEVGTYQYGEPPSREGHFTQVIWAASERLGIGIHIDHKSGKWAVVCNYDPAGNLEVPWENAYEKNVPQPEY